MIFFYDHSECFFQAINLKNWHKNLVQVYWLVLPNFALHLSRNTGDALLMYEKWHEIKSKS